MKPDQLRFFLDSGAFSAWSAGKVVDIDEYIEFIKANIEVIDVYACLDVIPGSPGKKPTQKQRDEAAGETWKNYLYMKAQGLDPLPVYHYGEDIKWLRNMLEHGVDYIGLGGLVGISGTMRRVWLDRVFDVITDKNGTPIVKTHGFGMTSVPLLFRYPWHSVDSLTWNQVGRAGGVMFPHVDKDGEFLFDRPPDVVNFASRTKTARTNAHSFLAMPAGKRKHFMRWLSLCGVTLEELQADNYISRATCNIKFFAMVSAEAKTRRFQRAMSTKGLFF